MIIFSRKTTACNKAASLESEWYSIAIPLNFIHLDPTWILDYFPRVVIINNHKPDGLKWYKFIILWLRSQNSEISVSRDILHIVSRETMFLPLYFHVPIDAFNTWPGATWRKSLALSLCSLFPCVLLSSLSKVSGLHL